MVMVMGLALLRKLFSFLSSLWALADIVLDSVTIINYRAACQVSHGYTLSTLSSRVQSEEISCSYYALGILFMFLPVLFAILFFTVLLVRESAEFESVLEYVLNITLFYR